MEAFSLSFNHIPGEYFTVPVCTHHTSIRKPTLTSFVHLLSGSRGGRKDPGLWNQINVALNLGSVIYLYPLISQHREPETFLQPTAAAWIKRDHSGPGEPLNECKLYVFTLQDQESLRLCLHKGARPHFMQLQGPP